MKKIKDFRLKIEDLIVITIFCLFSTASFAQQDSALNRSVTVERDFQPVIQAAGKVSTKPAVVTTTIEPAPVKYSDYTAEVTPEASVSPMLSQPTRFEPARPFHGYIRGGLGHPNTLFDFGYRVDDGKKSILDIYAHHKAEWGLAALSKTEVGMNFTHPFNTCDLYFGINGGNEYYHKYGHFYDYSTDHGLWAKNSTAYPKPRSLGDKDKTSLWTAEAFIGVRANAKQDFQYMAQTGYMLFSKPGAVNEHQIRTKASFDWHSNAHHVGANVYVQNNLLQLTGLAAVIPDSLYSHCHDIRIEPYYAYEGRRFRIHVGVNLDVNVDAGKNSLSAIDDVSFAPSPHIYLEAQIAKQWLTIYGDIRGWHSSGSLQDYMESNRYLLIEHGIIDPQHATYAPVDAELGFHIRPHRDVLLEIHGGYAYMIKETNLIANAGDFDFFYANYQRGKIGGQLNYHYRDYVRVNLSGDYYIWSSDSTVLDRPNWDLALRIDGRIDKHWSLYSDNRFEGSRQALAYNESANTYTTHRLAPMVELNLGVQYEMWVGGKGEKLKVKGDGGQVLRPEPQPNLILFAQLNNWLHRKNEYYYGYRSQGINFLVGATFRF